MTSEESTLATPPAPASPLAGAPLRPREPGQVLSGRFRIVAPLGSGGMGQVFRALDLSLGQEVALKLLPARLVHDPQALRLLREEVMVARRVSHPNVCRVHDLGETPEGELFLTMELVEGETLAAVLRRVGRLASEKALQIGRQVAAGLAAAHAEGIVHRDLKPANVLLDADGRARVADFGLARAAAVAAEGGEIAGTPAYMAPEQLAGTGVTTRSDVYALGLVLYELFIGRRAVEGRTLEELRRRHESAAPVTPSDLVREMDPEVERVILRCLEKDPSRRPANALEVLTALWGGDALGAAVAAGQTPSPQAVAGSHASGALRPRTALALLLGFVLSLATGFILDRTTGGLRFALTDVIGVPLPPAVLAFRIQEHLSAVGLAVPAAPEVSSFVYDTDVVRWLEKPSVARGEALRAGRAPAIRFAWARGMPPAAARDPHRPPPVPDATHLPAGALGVRVDTRGRLLRLVSGPDLAVSTPRSVEETAATLLKAAGLDARLFSPADPVGVPPVFADRRLAFEGRVPEAPDLPLHAEVATFRGAPVYFEAWGPWGPPRPASPGGGFSGADFALLCDALGRLAAALFAWRNLRTGRADVRGGLRLAAFVLVADFLSGLLGARDVAGTGGMRLVTNLAMVALYGAATVWLVYVALEPHVRRLWPESLVSWTRLLAGRIRDPMVARDVLVGLFSYQALAVGTLAIILLLGGASATQFPLSISLAPLNGARFFVAALVAGPRNGVDLALFYMLVLLVTRTVVRRVKLAEVLFFAVFFVVLFGPLVLLSGSPGPAALALALFTSAAWTVMLTRVGFLSMVVLASVMSLVVNVPLSFDLSAWYADLTLVGVGLLVGLAFYGWWFSRAPRLTA